MTTATTVFAASAPFRTVHHGRFRILVTDDRITSGQHLVLVKGRVSDRPAVACRVASACITSTALDADDCDCAGQNRTALDLIDADGMGVLIHLDQEGRGNGLVAKIRALNGKDAGLDTFTAIEALGLPADNRNYSDVARILHELRVPSIRLLTNNPAKVAAVADSRGRRGRPPSLPRPRPSPSVASPLGRQSRPRPPAPAPAGTRCSLTRPSHRLSTPATSRSGIRSCPMPMVPGSIRSRPPGPATIPTVERCSRTCR